MPLFHCINKETREEFSDINLGRLLRKVRRYSVRNDDPMEIPDGRRIRHKLIRGEHFETPDLEFSSSIHKRVR